MFNFLADAPASGGFNLGPILMIVVLIAVFYFLLIRPENKRKKEAEQLRSNVHTGDQVTTIGGIVGKVVSVKDDKFVLETGADQVRVEFAKWAISTNDTATENAKAEAKKRQEEKMKAKAAKKEAKEAKKASKKKEK